MKELLCSIDPGRDKTGVALVHADGTLEKKCIVRTVDYEQELARLLAGKEIFALVMGNGTRHEVMQERTEALLSKLGREIPVALVDEKYTTEMGGAVVLERPPGQRSGASDPQGDAKRPRAGG